MTPRVHVAPALFRWACERSGHDVDAYAARFRRLAAWERGDALPTLKQLEAFAKATHTPVGFFFLPEPPVERVPIPDFRTIAGEPVARPSPDLLETIYVCQQRQEWYRDHARTMHEAPLSFVGSANVTDDVVETAASIRRAIGFDLEERRAARTWEEALRAFMAQADAAGVLVLCSGIVKSDTHRRLSPAEFRGFAIADALAPLVFVNGADTKSAQMFTLAHELAHVWLGASGVSDAEASSLPSNSVERWCNQVAAELLVPLDVFDAEYRRDAELERELGRLARTFKVSTLVVLRRMHDAGGLSREAMWRAYQRELARLLSLPRGEGGDFYRTQPIRLGRRFARALIESTLEGQTLHRDAFQLLGIAKHSTFQQLAQSLGVLG